MINNNDDDDNHIQNNIQFIDCLEFWVSSAKSFIKSFLQPMNFQVIGMRFNENRTRIQYLLLNNVISRNDLENQFQIEKHSYIKSRENQFIKVTSSISVDDIEFHKKHQLHGDFIQNISFYCKDINLAYNKSIGGGAQSIQLPIIQYFNNKNDFVESAIIESPFKDLQHTFINRGILSSSNPLALYPEFNEIKDNSFPIDQDKSEYLNGSTGSLDHIATCIKHGTINYFINWYKKCLGFKLLSDSSDGNGMVDESENFENELILDKNFYVITKSDFKYTKKENIGLKMVVLANQPLNTPFYKTPPIQFVISEAIEGGEGQIEQFIHYFGSEGVQHLAFNSQIFRAVENAKSQKLEFVYIPDSYYSKLDERLKHLFPNSIPKKLKDNLTKFGILIDSDSDLINKNNNNNNNDNDNNNIEDDINKNIGYIKQIFSKYITDKPTMFFELIERSNALGFGKGNIIALFESLEKETEKK